jgi:hypothetical protein
MAGNAKKADDRHIEVGSLPDISVGVSARRELAIGFRHFSRRIDRQMVGHVAECLPVGGRNVFARGSNAFADIAADAALGLGLPQQATKTERYGG